MKKGKYIDWNILKRSMDHELSEEKKIPSKIGMPRMKVIGIIMNA